MSTEYKVTNYVVINFPSGSVRIEENYDGTHTVILKETTAISNKHRLYLQHNEPGCLVRQPWKRVNLFLAKNKIQLEDAERKGEAERTRE